jgi:glucan-binding YG repeat protein
MQKKNILRMLMLAGAITIVVGSTAPIKHNAESQNHILLTHQTKAPVKVTKNENLTKGDTSNQELTNLEATNLKGKAIKKDGMVFSGISAMKIAPNMTNSFLATPGFDSEGFASSINRNLYNYELNLENDQNTMKEAITLNGGNPVNTCVFFQSSALRGINQNVPTSIGYTTHLENWLSNNGWSKHSNFAYIQKGDLCFASYYHTFLFMGWKDKARGIAWVMGNESFVQPYYRKRNLNGQSPQIYGDNSYTGATVYWTHGQGYQGPESNPLHKNEYNAFGSTTVKTQTSLYQNQGSGRVYSQIPKGTNLPVIKSQNGWYQVYYKENLGWINASAGNGIAESLGGSVGTANTITGSNIGGPYKHIQSTKDPSIGTGVIIANGLWLNSEPKIGTGIKVLTRGANISVIAQQGNWYKIQYYGQIGWISANPNYVQTMMSPKNPSPAANAPKKYIAITPLSGTTVVNTAISLNSDPETTQDGASIIADIPSGTTVQVLGETPNKWYKVIYKGKTGYIGSSFTNGCNINPKLKWETINGKKYYYNNKGTKVTGWQTINENVYNFNNEGVMQTGWIHQWGVNYYFADNGTMVKGIQTINGKKYKFNNQGILQTGWQTIDGKIYNFNNEGVMQTGWIHQWGVNYYFATNGAMVKGIQTIDGNGYNFNNHGIMQTGWIHQDGKNYYFADNGIMTKGWETINGNVYNFNNHGIMQTGWIHQWGVNYYFADNGTMVKGIQTINGKKYKFNNQGILQTGWQTIDGNIYNFNNEGVMQTGWIHQWGVNYYFADNGTMVKGWKTIDGKIYNFNNHGIMQTGWIHQWGVNYYFATNGAMVKGIQTIDGNSYNFNNHGIMQTGWIHQDGKNYYFAGNGTMVKGWKTIDGNIYNFNNHGIMQTGWIHQWGVNYYFADNGTMVKGWNKIAGTWYHMNNHGIVISN